MNNQIFSSSVKYICISFLLIILTGQRLHSAERDSLINRGLDLTFAMHFDEAIAVFDQVIAQDTSYPAGYFMKSAVHFWKFTRNYRSQKIGDEFESVSLHARDVAERFLDNHENDQDGLFYLGGIYGNLGRYYAIKRNYWDAFWNGRKGKNLLEDLVEINPEYYDAYLGLGIYHYYAAVMPKFLKFFSFLLGIDGEKEQGLRELQMAVDKGTLTNNEARIFLSTIYLRVEHEYEKALKLIQELIDQYPHNQAFRVSKGWALTRLGRDPEALQIFDRIISNNPDYPLVVNQARYYSGNIYFKHNKFRQALRSYRQVIEKSADVAENRHWIYARSLMGVGRCYEMLGQWKIARTFYEMVSENWGDWIYRDAQDRLQNPMTTIDINLIKAENFCEIAKFDSAFAILDSVNSEISDKSDDQVDLVKAKIFHYRGRIFLERHEWQQAIEDLENYFTVDVEKPERMTEWNHYYLGYAYAARNEIDLAEEHLEQALDSDSFRLKNRADILLTKIKNGLSPIP